MRTFRFNLEKLLELRGFHERKAEMVLAEKAGRCALLDARLRELLTLQADLLLKVQQCTPN